MNRKTRQAIARIEVRAGGDVISRGTGTLVGRDLVLTALHVVADRTAVRPEPYEGEIWLCFPSGEARASLLDDAWDAAADWALLRCDAPEEIEPVELAHLGSTGVAWETFGFPDANAQDGMVQTGTVANHEAQLGGVPALQLYSQQAAAGQGAPVHGLSGAPVLVHGYLVGHLRFALMRDQRTIAGTLYGCPLAALSDQLDGPLFEGIRVRRRAVKAASSRRSAAAVVLLLIVLLVGGWSWLRRDAASGAISATDQEPEGEVVVRPSLSILGFRNLNGGEELDWLTTALSEVLTSGLGAGEELRVVRFGSEVAPEVDLASIDGWSEQQWQQLASLTTTQNFVTGSVFELEPDLVRVEVQVWDDEGEIVLAETASGLATGVFSLIEQICEGIRAKMAVGELTSDMALAVMASVPNVPQAARAYAQGLEALREYDVDFARRRFEEAIAAEPNSPLPHAGLARVHLYSGEYAAAADAANRALEVSDQLLASERSSIEATREKALGNFLEAADIYRQRFERHRDDVFVGVLLAGAQNSAGQARRALATTDALSELPGALGEHPSIFREAAIARMQLGEPELALEAAQRAVELAGALGSVTLEASTYEVQADALEALGEWRAGSEALAEAQRLYGAAEDRFGVARALEGRGRLLQAQGDLKTASVLLREAEETYREMGDRFGEAALLLQRAALAMDAGDLGQMRELATRSERLYRDVGSLGEAGAAINSLAITHHLTGDVESAQREYRRALEAFTSAERRDARAVVLRNLGELAYLRCNVDAAKSLHEDALALNRTLGIRLNEAYDLYRLGLVSMAADRLDVARQRFEEAEAVFVDLGARLGEAEVRIGRSELLRLQDETSTALSSARTASEILQDAGSRDLEALARLAAVRALIALGNRREALEELRLVQQIESASLDVRVSLQLAAARADLALRNPGTAPEGAVVEQLQRALRESEANGLVLFALQLGRQQALLLLADGDLAEAATRLRDLAQRADDLGCALEARLARRILERELG